MTKREMIDKISDQLGISKSTASKVLDAVNNELAEVLKAEGKVVFPGMGTLKIGTRAARVVKHPKTKEKISVPEGKTVRFSASKKLKDFILEEE